MNTYDKDYKKFLKGEDFVLKRIEELLDSAEAEKASP